jgi:hypothetical protein
MPKRKGKSQKSKVKSVYRKILIWYVMLSVIFVSLGAVLSLVNPPCANSISCIKDLSGAIEKHPEGVFLGQKVLAPSYLEIFPLKKVLGTRAGPRHISVDLSRQRLYAYEGNQLVYEFPVSTGKWGRTPTGEFRIWIKLLRTKMEGGSGNTYYYLPNVPYVMFFYNDRVSRSRGFAIHGAYWHNNFGYPMSYGCINLRPEDAGKLFEWAEPVSAGSVTHANQDNPGTVITIYGQPPT